MAIQVDFRDSNTASVDPLATHKTMEVYDYATFWVDDGVLYLGNTVGEPLAGIPLDRVDEWRVLEAATAS